MGLGHWHRKGGGSLITRRTGSWCLFGGFLGLLGFFDCFLELIDWVFCLFFFVCNLGGLIDCYCLDDFNIPWASLGFSNRCPGPSTRNDLGFFLVGYPRNRTNKKSVNRRLYRGCFTF